MELSSLRIFKTVAEEGSVTQAAARLNRVQSNVSARLNQLEESLGVTLFNRSGRRMLITAEGARLLDYGLAVVAAVAAAALAWALSHMLALPNISLVFLAAVLLVAVRSSLGPALLCAGLTFLAYDFLFIPPTLSLTIARQEDVLTLLLFLLMAALTGNLASRQRRQLEALRDTQVETGQLLDLSRKLTAATDRQAVLNVAAQQFGAWSDLEICLLSRGRDGVWKVEAGVQRLLVDQERAAAEWSWQHDQPAGLGTDTLPGGRWWWLPLSAEEGPLVLLGVSPRD